VIGAVLIRAPAVFTRCVADARLRRLLCGQGGHKFLAPPAQRDRLHTCGSHMQLARTPRPGFRNAFLAAALLLASGCDALGPTASVAGPGSSALRSHAGSPARQRRAELVGTPHAGGRRARERVGPRARQRPVERAAEGRDSSTIRFVVCGAPGASGSL
jgi:hypothetical protein